MRHLIQILTCWIPVRSWRKKIRNQLLNPFGFFSRIFYQILFSKEIDVLTSLNKCQKFTNGKPTLAMQVTSMDKGGLEEVVLGLVTNKVIIENYNVIILEIAGNIGHLGKIAQSNNIPVIPIFQNLRSLKAVIEFFNIEIVHIHYDLFGVSLYHENNIQMVYTIHGCYIWMTDESIKLRASFYPFLKHIAVSSSVKAFFCKKFAIDEKSIDVIPNGIETLTTDQTTIRKKESLGYKENDFILICVARLDLIKYHFAQLEALSKLKLKYDNIKLLLLGNVGDITYHTQLLNFIAKYDLNDSVKIVPYVPKNEVFAYIRLADCYISTSLCEGFGIATLEAMHENKPLILTDVGAARDFIQDSDIGIIVSRAFSDISKIDIFEVLQNCSNECYNFSNVDELIAAIENIYLNQSDWQEKAKKGKAKVLETYTNDYVAQNYKKIYDLCLNNKY